jgi:uncharacterized protein (TIRG00374 family)
LQQPAFEPEAAEAPDAVVPAVGSPSPIAVDGELAQEAEELAHAAERPRRRPWLRWLLLAAFVALAVKLVQPQLGPLQDSMELLKTMVPGFLVLAAIVQVASYVWSGVMIRDIVRLTGDELSVARGTAVSVASGSVGLVAAGAIGTAGSTFRWLRDAGVSPEGALLASWLPTVLNAAVMVVFGLVGTAELVLQGGMSVGEGTALAVAFAGVAAACAFLWWAAGHPAPAERLAVVAEARWARLRRKSAREADVRERVRATYEALELLKRRGWKRPMVDSALMIGFDALTLWLVFVAMLDVISPHVFFAGYAIPLLVSKFGVVPGGVGLVEGMMVAIFHHVGEQTSVATLAVIAYRLLAFWVPNLIGFGLVPFLQAAPRRARVEE